jgi:hypothetical protein
MRNLAIAAIILPILATVAHAEDRPLYNAQDTLRRAQIGTHSPRLAPPVRVTPAPTQPGKSEPSRYDRMDCRPDPSRPLDRAIVCHPMKS